MRAVFGILFLPNGILNKCKMLFKIIVPIPFMPRDIKLNLA